MPLAVLTKRQNDVYERIRAHVREHAKPPTLHELGKALGIRTTNGVSKHLHALEQKGYIRRLPNEARGIELLDAGADSFAFDADTPSLPLVSRTNSAEPDTLRRRPKGCPDDLARAGDGVHAGLDRAGRRLCAGAAE